MSTRHWIGLGAALSLAAFCGFAQPVTNSTLSTSNLWFNEFVFLPGGFRRMANPLSVTNETFRLALRYIGESRGGHAPPKLPPGLTLQDVSNVNYIIFEWTMTVPPRPISFYGKVVDENDQPVVGAIAHFQWDGTVTNKNALELKDDPKISLDETSDRDGLFALKNKTGTALDVSVAKAGYYQFPQNRGAQYFKYSKMNLDSFYGIGDYFKPDSNNPVLYRLHKAGVGVANLVIDEGFLPDVPFDGTPVNVDLLHRKTGSGPLEIRQTKPERAKWQTATNWSFSMRISDGGFLEQHEEFPFRPPESGYQPLVEFRFRKGETNWTIGIRKDYYIKFGNPPVYGELQMETGFYQAKPVLKYVINPNGSRNLEAKQGDFPELPRWQR